MLEKGYKDELIIEPFPGVAKNLISEASGQFDLLLVGGRIQEIYDAGPKLARFARGRCPDIKIILMSSLYSRDEALQAGADEYWYTNSNFEELFELIDKIFAS